jgi:hypothetical protein
VTPLTAEDLRRRLYRPGADDGDVAAYLEATHEDGPPAPEPVRQRRPRSRRRRPVLVAAGGLVALLALLGVVRTLGEGQEAGPAAAVLGTPTPSVAPLPTAFVEPDTRIVFLRNLLSGRDAGLLAWVDDHGWAPEVPRDRFVETHGTGDGVVSLPVGSAAGDGRLVVLLVLAEDGVASWSSARLVLHDDRTVRLAAVSTRTGSLQAGVPTYGRVDFGWRDRPMRVIVEAPAGATWGLAAVVLP